MKQVKNINLDNERGEDSMERKIANTMKGRIWTTMVCVPLVFTALFLLSFTCGVLMPETAQATVPIADCAGCHGYTASFTDGTARNNPVGAFNGSHNTHVVQAQNPCSDCHIIPATTTSADFDHRDGYIQLSAGNFGNRGAGNYIGKPAANFPTTNTPTFSYCQNTYCHSSGTSASNGGIAANNSPVWGNGNNTATCYSCHGVAGTEGAPNYASGSPKKNSHQAASHAAQPCSTCHYATTSSGNTITGPTNHTNGAYNVVPNTAAANFNYTFNTNGGTCNNGTCHGSVAWGGTLGCVQCHNQAQTGTHGTPRDVITTEFGLTYGHKKTGRGTVADADCIVCHLEGNFTTQKAAAPWHGDGNINLRDPDGAGENGITNIGGANYWFTTFTISFANGARNSANHRQNTVSNILTQKFCLACHDSNGATNPTARSANNATAGGANQYMPFGGLNMGTTYWPRNGAARNGGLIDVKTAAANTNSSKHPMQGPLFKAFPNPNKMHAGYNGFTRNSAANTKAVGVVLTCFDCHFDGGYSAAGSNIGTRSVISHGTANWLRGNYAGTAAANNSLCNDCHVAYTTTGGNHGSGSALATGTSSMSTLSTFATCQNCHFSATTKPARPIPAADLHGFNTMASGANVWGYGNSAQARPFAFLRNVVRFTATSPRPAAGANWTTAVRGNCGGSAPAGCGDDMSNYTPGGQY